MSSFKNTMIKGTPIYKEKVVATAITPGMLVDLDSADKFIPNGTANDVYPAKMFCVERDYQGDLVTTEQAADSQGQVAICQSGCEVQAILLDAEVVVIGSDLMSTGDGTLSLWATSGAVVAKALEAMTASGDTKIHVLVM